LKTGRIAAVLAALLACGALAAVWAASPAGKTALRGLKAEREVRQMVAALPGVRRDSLRVAMPDGVRLATDVYLPADAGPVPAILVRLPYGRTRYWEVRQWVRLFAPEGYAVVVQDMRGRWGSEGVFAPWPNAATDGAATLDWIAAQPWSDGKVGTIGCSALGEHQFALGATRHPALKAMVALGAGGAAGELDGLWNHFGMFEGGVPTLSAGFGWFTQSGGKTAAHMAPVPVDHAAGLATLPVRDAVARFRPDPTDWEALLDAVEAPGFGRDWGYMAGGEVFDAAVLIGDTWYDHSVSATFALWRLAGRGAQVVMGPGTHCDFAGPFRSGAVGDLPVVRDETYDETRIWRAFLDHHLKGGPVPDLPPVRVYALGEDRWEDWADWPPAGSAAQVLPLDGDALGRAPEAATARSFVSDPADPVPSIGGATCCTGNPEDRPGPLDQRPIEGRADVLVWTSAPLAGPIRARLRVSAEVPDADLVVRLTEVLPDGRSLMVQEGALRLRYRGGFTTPRLLTPGETVDVEVSLRDIRRTIPAGHRLRLHVAGSSFPRLARNLQGGGAPNDETDPVPGRLSVHMGPGAGSALILHSLAPPRFSPERSPG
jgi:putative CocE/NonD family hydrolase